MTPPGRLAPLLAQYDWTAERLVRRLRGPTVDSGDDNPIPVPALSDDEYVWEPVPGAWSIRRHADGPRGTARLLVGAGEWGREGGRPHPIPPPVTTIAWRILHLVEMLVGRTDHTIGSRTFDELEQVVPPDADSAVAALAEALDGWRVALDQADDAALDTIGHSAYPYGGDPEVPFLEVVWWVNQEVLHHGAEIALLRDLYAARDLRSPA